MVDQWGGKTTAQELCKMCCEVGLNQKAIKGDILVQVTSAVFMLILIH